MIWVIKVKLRKEKVMIMNQSENPATKSQSQKITEDASGKIPQKMSELFGSVEKLGAKMNMNVKNVKDKNERRVQD